MKAIEAAHWQREAQTISPMQAQRLGQIEACNHVKHARGDNIRVAAADIENVKRLPVAINPGADVEQPRWRVFALVDVALLSPGRVRDTP